MNGAMQLPTPPASALAEPCAVVYDLRIDGCSDKSYEDAARFSDRLLAEIDLCAATATHAYSEYVRAQRQEPPRSLGEYAIDLLTLGLVVRRYGRAAEDSPAWAIKLARWLFRLRSKQVWIKPVADLLRAALVRLFLLPPMERGPREGTWPLERLPRLIAWLQATGEFEQEALRIEQWRSFFGTLPSPEALHWIETASYLFDWFEREAEQSLGAYAKGVPGFLATEYASRGCREDQIFCGKSPAEYLLAMVAAEIMNQGLRAEFDRTPVRAVLVPACLRGEQAARCLARVSGVDMICTACDPACAVNRITRRMRKVGAQVYLVPHSTGFSRWLERWQHAPGVGVVAVACLLNILPGGYEMRSRGIAAQCVPLDYPGCRKHWRRKGVNTSVNENRLVQITTTPAIRRESAVNVL
jgi:hypothetical protein